MKTVTNYTDQQEKLIIAVFQKVMSFAEQKTALQALVEHEPALAGKSYKQLLGKLQNLSSHGAVKPDGTQLYTRKVYMPKVAGTTPIRKAELVSRIAELLSCEEEVLNSLESANKAVLLIIVGALSEKVGKVEVLETLEAK